MIVGVTSSCTGDTDRTLHLVPKFLQHPHELIVHFKDSASTTAGHFRLAEVGSDQVNHDSPHCEKECSTTNTTTKSQFSIRCLKK